MAGKPALRATGEGGDVVTSAENDDDTEGVALLLDSASSSQPEEHGGLGAWLREAGCADCEAALRDEGVESVQDIMYLVETLDDLMLMLRCSPLQPWLTASILLPPDEMPCQMR